ncbi:hypothetical protein ACFPOI_24400 [Nonomuraea angiospora]|uniref:Secreted protein n=1 Tax=Nonomuraea angiospora TaxID=46172 RepID=A0ABR9MME5_9ACTN|nr:hypothetical protein [Nonomuraea angiospora]MBE1593820.1 hypothetical protein [Nonomuraea angiospora]
MAEHRVRLAALTMGVVSMLVASGGVADASAGRTYRVTYQGPFSADTTCNAYSAALNDPPDVYSSPCFYSESGVPGYKLLPGWYFRYQYSID